MVAHGMGIGVEVPKGVKDRRAGLLTEEQLLVLGLRLEGMKQDEIARKLGTSRQNVSLIERRARDNIAKAASTLKPIGDLRPLPPWSSRPAPTWSMSRGCS